MEPLPLGVPPPLRLAEVRWPGYSGDLHTFASNSVSWISRAVVHVLTPLVEVFLREYSPGQTMIGKFGCRNQVVFHARHLQGPETVPRGSVS